ncbi:hypothetical protein GCM10025871_07150 [Deinococcus metallilatus]|nr:hypothetical protein GCM10025871_07150 [Deinococcus metallilatus]
MGEYSDPMQMYFELKTLLRAILESKFNNESYDKEILGSETVAAFANRIVDDLDQLHGELFKDFGKPNRSWLRLNSIDNRIYETALRKVVDQETKSNDRFWLTATTHELETFTRTIFAPYTVSDEIIDKFIDAVRESIRD